MSSFFCWSMKIGMLAVLLSCGARVKGTVQGRTDHVIHHEIGLDTMLVDIEAFCDEAYPTDPDKSEECFNTIFDRVLGIENKKEK